MSFTITQSGVLTIADSAANETYLTATIDSVTGWLVVVWSSDGANGGLSGTFAKTYGIDIVNGGFPAVKISDFYGDVSIASISDNTSYAITINVTGQNGHGIHVVSGHLGGDRADEEYILDPAATGTQVLNAQIVRTADGGVIGTWASEVGDGSSDGILGLRINGSGISGGITHVNTYTSGEQTNAAVAALTAGGYVIAWESEGQDAGHSGIYMQRYDASGNKSSIETRVNTTSGDESTPDIGAVTGGGYVVTWVSQVPDGNSAIMGQRYTASGSTAGDEFQVTTTIAANTPGEVAGLGNGGFVVVWGQTSGDQHSLMAQIYDSSGVKSSEQILIASSTHALTDMDVTTSAGGFLVTWSGIGADGTANSFMERFGSANDSGHYITGTDGDDTLTGDYGSDTLVGGAGNDVLWNGEVMYGGKGNDTFHTDVGQLIDGGDGVDEADYYNNLDLVVDLLAGSVSAPHANSILIAVENVVTANGNDKLYGDNNANALNGGFGDDILDGRGGVDTMMGGDGSDTYFVDNVGDVVIDDGLNYEYYQDTEYSSVSRMADAGIEILRLTGSANLSATAGADLIQMFGNSGNNNLTGNSGDNRLVGNAGNDILNGGFGADIMDGGAGNDTYYVDNAGDTVVESSTNGTDTVYASASYSASGQFVENIYITGTDNIGVTGNSLNNILLGNSGNNTLNGGSGADTMNGGAGNDTYIVDNSGDIVIEGATGSTDAIYASSSFSINGTYIENLFLTGTSNLNASGNGYNNLLVGNDGNNTLNGSIGADIMNGGAGNDTYIVDNAGDIVIEGATGGSDTIYASSSYSINSTYIENLFLTGNGNVNASGNSYDNLLVGNDGNNTLNGSTGADTMNGGNGNDTYIVDNVNDTVIEGASGGTDTIYASISYSLGGRYVESLFLTGTANINATGNSGDNLLVGNKVGNVMNGGEGADTMNGGLGNDTYYVDNAGDVVIEGASGGTDTMHASLSWSLSGTYVENLILDGTADLNATGNSNDNILTGNSGSNTLNGGAGNDTLNGGVGNDILIGGTGNDIMYGGSGNDTYYVDNIGDAVIDNGIGDTDTIVSSTSYILGSSAIERVILAGSANINITGTSAYYTDSSYFTGNTLVGNTGNNVITAGTGSDTLTGGGGNDIFVFDYFSTGADTITDFSNDTINLHAYSHGVANGGGITISQASGNTTIDLGHGNIVTLTGIAPVDLTAHIIW
jgi:Ca2+-binding RTX toxin-like protein